MPWVPPKANAQKVQCDLCSVVTKEAYVGPLHAERDARVRWPKGDENPKGIEYLAWCPQCASAASDRASQSYQSKGLHVESLMSDFWEAPTALAVPGNTAANTHRDCVPPMAPLPGTSSSQIQQIIERLAALEEEVANLRLSVAELEEHSSGAATG